jgi:DeoR/GlpR family transcriptional regulator of sugar metabolism
MLPEARRSAIVEMLRMAGSVSVTEVEAKLGVSPMTARRDLAELARRGQAQRTHGGAVVPSISAHEDSFALRLDKATDAKLALSEAAVDLIGKGDTVFLDSSSTSYFLARRLLETALEMTLLTNSLPVMQLVSAHNPHNIDLIGVGGQLRPLTQSFVGPHALRTIEGHFVDHAFVSIKALTATGMLTDADPLEAEVKRAMIDQAAHPVLLIDRSKLGARGLNAVVPSSSLKLVIAHGLKEAELRDCVDRRVPIRILAGRTDDRVSATPALTAGVTPDGRSR